MPESTKEWTSFSESEVVWPFKKSDNALDGSRIRYSPTDEFSAEESKQFEENPLFQDNFSPELDLKIDTDLLFSKTGLAENLISISIVARDRAIRRFILIEKDDLSKLNNTQITIPANVLSRISGMRGIEFVVILTAKRSNFTQYQIGDKIAEKVFSCTLPNIENSSFPFSIIDPDSESWPESYSKDTVYFIQWDAPSRIYEPDVDIKEVLTVCYNKKFTDRIYSLNQKSSAIQTIWKQIIIDIYMEISMAILQDDTEDPPSTDDHGLYSKVVSKLEGIFQIPFLDIRNMKKDLSFTSQLRSKLQCECDILKDLKTLKA